jgi:flagellar hook assembly protein FlgD
MPWDGKNKNGNDVTEGAYFYDIEIGHDFDAIKGSVTIIR